MAVTVDARGLPCPQPVIRTRNAMREADEIVTLVTEENQVSNVRRLAERSGWRVMVKERQDGYAVHMVKGEAAPEARHTRGVTNNVSWPWRKISGISLMIPMAIICVLYIRSVHHLSSSLMTILVVSLRFIMKSRECLRYPGK